MACTDPVDRELLLARYYARRVEERHNEAGPLLIFHETDLRRWLEYLINQEDLWPVGENAAK
jgi:hypothetical protein